MEAPKNMTNAPQTPLVYRISELAQNRASRFELRPDADELEKIAANLKLEGLRKLSFQGELTGAGKRDWVLKATLGATVIQNCVVTLTPVTTRIDVTIERRYLADFQELSDEEEIEMPEDENSEPLPAEINISQTMEEALALHLPLYPRADGATLEAVNFTEPGKTPMTDEDARPFSALSALRDKLSGPEDTE